MFTVSMIYSAAAFLLFDNTSISVPCLSNQVRAEIASKEKEEEEMMEKPQKETKWVQQFSE